MPIDFIRVSILSHTRGQSTVGLGAYLCREDWTNDLTGKVHRHAASRSDLVAPPIVILPEGADPRFADPLTLWTAAERAETTFDRKTKKIRFKKGATFAKHAILALPKELTDSERQDLTLQWINKSYPGVAVMAVLHKPDDLEFGNHHAHLLITTRVITGNKLGKKARHLDPVIRGKAGGKEAFVENQDLPGQWRAFQTDYFIKHGISLDVDVSRSISGLHWENARYIPDSGKSADDAKTKAAARAKMLVPANVVTEATKNRATFTDKSLLKILRQHQIDGQEAEEIIDRIFTSPDTVALYDADTGSPTRLFTSRHVRDQETDILSLAEKLTRRRTSATRLTRLQAAAAEITPAMNLADEQLNALTHATGKTRLCIIRGVAGTGKSYANTAIRKSHEAAGFHCVGLVPTNAVVASMKSDGFAQASTLHAEQYRQEHGKRPHLDWTSKTCVVVDEAGMVDAEMTEWLLRAAEETGAKVILVGDEAQLASVSRGCLFGVLKAHLGAAELKQVRRQQAAWSREATIALADERVAEGLNAYAARGCVHFANELSDARSALIVKWKKDHRQRPDLLRFVYCATNAIANDLNRQLQHARFGDKGPVSVFDCDRGKVALYPTDRVQFHTTDKTLGIFNGHIGEVTTMSEHEIEVELDTGGRVSFNPDTFTGWGLGYAGTIYRGQGKTLPQTYALYDSVMAWSARASYVALTRHKEAFDLFVPRSLAKDVRQLGRQMSRRDGADASLCYLTKEEADRYFPRVPVQTVTDEGAQREIDAASTQSAPDLDMHWSRVPAPQFAQDFRRIKAAAVKTDNDHPLHVRVNEATTIARGRGFYPWNGKPDSRCLVDFLLPTEGLKRSDDPVLTPANGEIDIRPIVIEIDDIEAHDWMKMNRRLRRLDHHVLDAIVDRLSHLANRVKADTSILANIDVARYFTRLAGLLKWRDASGNVRPRRSCDEFRNIPWRKDIPRKIKGQFYISRKDELGELIDWDILGFVTKRNRPKTAEAAVERIREVLATRDSLAARPINELLADRMTDNGQPIIIQDEEPKTAKSIEQTMPKDKASRDTEFYIDHHIRLAIAALQEMERSKPKLANNVATVPQLGKIKAPVASPPIIAPSTPGVAFKSVVGLTPQKKEPGPEIDL